MPLKEEFWERISEGEISVWPYLLREGLIFVFHVEVTTHGYMVFLCAGLSQHLHNIFFMNTGNTIISAMFS